MITTQLLMDYTNYEFTSTGDKVPTWEWTEDGNDIGVRLQVEMVHDEQMLKVISHDTNGYVLLTQWQIESHLLTAINVMQFAEYWDQEEWPLQDLVEINNAMDQTLSFSGSELGLGVSYGWGNTWIEKAEIGWQVITDYGMVYHVGTIYGFKKLWPKLRDEFIRMSLGWTNRRVADLAKQPT